MTTTAGNLMRVDAAPDPARGNVVRIGRHVGVLGPGQARIAVVRQAAEDVLLVHDRPPREAGWAMAVVAAAMLPGPAPPAVLLAWLQTEPTPTPAAAAPGTRH